MLKSRPDRYGATAVSIHWLSAILILALLGSGFQAANAMDASTKADFLRFHIRVARAVLLLTIIRVWWWHTGDPGMTRTCDLRFRKPSLYPAELRDRIDFIQDFQSKNFGCWWAFRISTEPAWRQSMTSY
jgi:Prokaryotic cytochrome b561